MYKIYTDGAFSSLRNRGGWSFVVVKNDDKVYSNFDTQLDTTNNRMEIQASLEAMLWMKNNNVSSSIIVTDSMYVINTMTKGWKRNKNNDLWDKIDEAINGLTIDWQHVKGHSGNKWNELCDVLAVHGSNIIEN